MKLLTHYYDPPGPSVERMQAFCEEMLYCTDLATPEFVKERFEESIRPGRKEGQQSAIAALRAQESEAKKGSVWSASALITQPTLLLWGREDRPAPLDKGLMWLKRIPNATLTIVPYCGHWVQMEYPQMFDSLTRTFIQNA